MSEHGGFRSQLVSYKAHQVMVFSVSSPPVTLPLGPPVTHSPSPPVTFPQVSRSHSFSPPVTHPPSPPVTINVEELSQVHHQVLGPPVTLNHPSPPVTSSLSSVHHQVSGPPVTPNVMQRLPRYPVPRSHLITQVSWSSS